MSFKTDYMRHRCELRDTTRQNQHRNTRQGPLEKGGGKPTTLRFRLPFTAMTEAIVDTIFPFQTAILDCVATLENPRNSPHQELARFFDALIVCYDENTGGNRPLLCSVRHDGSGVNNIVTTGTHRISLKVRYFDTFTCRHFDDEISLYPSNPTPMWPAQHVAPKNIPLWATLRRYGISEITMLFDSNVNNKS